jgi:hypothetical protein
MWSHKKLNEQEDIEKKKPPDYYDFLQEVSFQDEVHIISVFN